MLLIITVTALPFLLSSKKTIQIIEISRHGARHPLHHHLPLPLPANGLITPTGLKQHYRLGTYIKNKYPHFFEHIKGDWRVKVVSSKS